VITIHQRHRRTDGQTDRQTTYDRNTALCTKVHRAVKSEITTQRGWLKWCKKMISNSKLVVVEVSLSFTRWRHYVPKLI